MYSLSNENFVRSHANEFSYFKLNSITRFIFTPSKQIEITDVSTVDDQHETDDSVGTAIDDDEKEIVESNDC